MRRPFSFLPILPLVCTFVACELGSFFEVFGGSERPIKGRVTVDDESAPGITVEAIRSGEVVATDVTDQNGNYEMVVEVDHEYTVRISGFAIDVRFGSTQRTVHFERKYPERIVDFHGNRIRASSVTGTVFLDGGPQPGITVTLVEPNLSTTTGGFGKYEFSNLLMGTYTVTISGAPAGAVFDAASKNVTLGVEEVAVVDFIGYREIGEITGRVGVRVGNTEIPLAGITVSARRLPADAILTTTTGDDGLFAITNTRLGQWLLEISGWPNDVITFDEPTTTFELTDQAPTTVQEFWGRYRPGSVSGTVTLDGAPAIGLTVRITDVDGVEHVATTGDDGTYTAGDVAAGTATIALDLDEGATCEDHPRAVTVPPAASVTADFSCASPEPEPEPLVPLTFDLSEAESPANQTLSPGTSFDVPVRNPDDEVAGEVAIETGPAATYFLYPNRLYVEAPGAITITPTGFSLEDFTHAVFRFADLSGIHSTCQVESTLLDAGGNTVGGSSHSSLDETLEIALTASTTAIRIALVQVGPRECEITTLSLRGGTFQP